MVDPNGEPHQMEFRILGPLDVRLDGSTVPILGQHQPKLLALLLLENDRTVSLGRMVDALWDDDPPATAKRQVQNAMAALRRSLTEAELDPVARVGEGYRLTTSELDHSEFTTLVRRGRGAAEAGRFDTAFMTLTDALGVWRGPALAGIPGRIFEAAANRLEEERLSVMEDRFAAALASDRSAEFVGELRELVAEHPYRQRFTQHLMTALHRVGQTEVALAAFDHLGSRLRDDLGLDPDPDLRRLRDSIRDGEDSTIHSSAVVSTQAPPPAQLPASIRGFIGRGEQLSELDALLAENPQHSVAVLSGVGGSGKTALAIHWAAENREQFPDGQLYVNLRGFDTTEPVKPVDALHAFIRALGHNGDSPASIDDAVTLYRSLLARRRVLVVLDNALNADQVRPLLPIGVNVTLVTSRERLTPLTTTESAQSVSLDALSRSEAFDLLTVMIDTRRLHEDELAVYRLTDLCGHLPLALRMAGANLANRPHTSVATFVDELDSSSDRLELLAVEGDPKAALTSVFDRSIAAISDEARLLLLRLGFIPTADYAEELVIELSTEEADKTRELLTRLADAHLLERHRPNRYRFHDLIKAYVSTRLTVELDETTRDELVRRFTDWQVSTPRGEEFDNIVEACRAWRRRPRIWKLAAGLRRLLHWTVNVHTVTQLATQLLAETIEAGDPYGEIEMRHLLGMTAWVAGHADEAERYCREAIALAAVQGDGDANGTIRTNLSTVLSTRGGFDEAAQLLAETLELAEQTGATVDREVRALNLGALYRQLGRYDDAWRIVVSSEVETRTTVPQSTALPAGMLYFDMGRYADLKAWLSWVLAEEYSQLVPPQVRTIALGLRGEVHRIEGEYEAARTDLDQAIAIAERSGRTAIAYEARCTLAQLHCDTGEAERGLALVEHVLATPDAARKPDLLALARLTAARISRRIGEFPTANHHVSAALEISESISQPLRIGRCLLEKALLCADLGDGSQAETLGRQARDIFDDLGVPEAEHARSLLDTLRAAPLQR
ncbi:AfsR/SARP family transcriptional regulator [Stackebrandtia nassauensis]|nr:BTAD domain-containing putative transcriptional regulator [Stackebrandtia nassauensis]